MDDDDVGGVDVVDVANKAKVDATNTLHAAIKPLTKKKKTNGNISPPTRSYQSGYLATGGITRSERSR